MDQAAATQDARATLGAGTDEHIVARAEALIPVLRERAGATNADRRPSGQTCLDIKRSGVVQLFQPARYGGAEARLATGIDVLAAIGRGCGSTAWIVVQNITHNMMIASWPEAAQDAIWKTAPDALVSGILIPNVGKARRTDGGYVLSGRWPFVSGVDVSDWLMFTAPCPNERGAIEDRHFLLPSRQATILDTWHAIGLRGSASNDVLLDDVFVPEHMTITIDDLKGHSSGPGQRVNSSPIYRIPPYALFGCYIGAAVLGIAEAAVDYYVEAAKRRSARMSGAAVSGYVTQQVKVAEARAAVIASRRLLHSICDEAQGIADAGGRTTSEDRTRFRALAAYAGKLATSAVSLVLEAGGGSVIYERDPVSRCVADVTVAARHTTQNWDVNASAYGRALLGLPIDVPALED